MYLQDKIREYTNKLLTRRSNKSQDPTYDKVQAARDIRELKAIQQELEARRTELQYGVRAETGGILYRETRKLNARAKLSHVRKVK
jgi:hypothetical protein